MTKRLSWASSRRRPTSAHHTNHHNQPSMAPAPRVALLLCTFVVAASSLATPPSPPPPSFGQTSSLSAPNVDVPQEPQLSHSSPPPADRSAPMGASATQQQQPASAPAQQAPCESSISGLPPAWWMAGSLLVWRLLPFLGVGLGCLCLCCVCWCVKRCLCTPRRHGVPQQHYPPPYPRQHLSPHPHVPGLDPYEVSRRYWYRRSVFSRHSTWRGSGGARPASSGAQRSDHGQNSTGGHSLDKTIHRSTNYPHSNSREIGDEGRNRRAISNPRYEGDFEA